MAARTHSLAANRSFCGQRLSSSLSSTAVVGLAPPNSPRVRLIAATNLSSEFDRVAIPQSSRLGRLADPIRHRFRPSAGEAARVVAVASSTRTMAQGPAPWVDTLGS